MYLNDILIYTNKKRAKHKKAVQWVLEQLQKYGLYANLQKYRFNTNEIYFLRFIISLPGVYIEPERIESIRN